MFIVLVVSDITKKRGFGPAAKKLQEQVDRMRKALDDLREQERIEKNKNQEYIDRQIANTQTYIDDVDRQLKNVLEQIAQKEAEERAELRRFHNQSSLKLFYSQFKNI